MNKKIYNTIKQRILSLRYEPGQSLNPKELAVEFGVSQTPIREIFLRLEWEKLVTILPKIGIHVTEIDFKELKEIYRTRILIEGELGRLAVQHISDEQLTEMKKLLESCKKTKGGQTREKLVELDKKFRDILFNAANCSTLQEISKLLYNQTLRVWHLTFDESDITSEVEMESKEIEDTIASFTKKEPNAAQKLRKEVIITWVDRLQKYYTRF